MDLSNNKECKLELDIFEGPLDLLLYLVKKNEIDICDIPIRQITDQYMDYLQMMKMLDLNIAGEFLVMASTLLYIKSRMLLPEDGEELEDDIEDPRSQLVEQLLEYRRFKEAGSFLKQREVESRSYCRRSSPEIKDQPADLDLSIFDLLSSFSRVLKKIEDKTPEEIFCEEVSVDDKIDQLEKLLEKNGVIRFGTLFGQTDSKMQIIATFLALLELIKLGRVKVFQKHSKDDITIKLIPAGQE